MCSSVGRLCIGVRRVLAVIIFLVLFGSLAIPSYAISAEDKPCVNLYNSFYIYNAYYGISSWDYNTDTMFIILIFCVCALLTLCSCFFLCVLIVSKKRARVYTFIAFLLSAIAVSCIFTVPLGWNYNMNEIYCNPSQVNYTITLVSNQGPEYGVYGTQNGVIWGPYWGWITLCFGCLCNFLLFVLSICTPQPNKKPDSPRVTINTYILPDNNQVINNSRQNLVYNSNQVYVSPPAINIQNEDSHPPATNTVKKPLVNAIDKTINNMLKNSKPNKISESWINSDTGAKTSLLVRGSRLCPLCNSLIEARLRCKNSKCPSCNKWFCFRCLEVVTWSGDHKTCCVLSHPHESCHWCFEKGLQVINGSSVEIIKDSFAHKHNFTPKL